MTNFPTTGLKFRIRGESVAASNSNITNGATFSSVADEISGTSMTTIGGAPLPVYVTNAANGKASLTFTSAVIQGPNNAFMQDVLTASTGFTYVFIGKANVNTSTTIFAKNGGEVRNSWWLNAGLVDNGLPSIWQDGQKAVGPTSIANGSFHCTIIRATPTFNSGEYVMQTSVDGVWGTADNCVYNANPNSNFRIGGADTNGDFRGSHTGLDYLVYDHPVTNSEAAQINAAAAEMYGTANTGQVPVADQDAVGFYGDSITQADLMGAACRSRLSTLRGRTVKGTVRGHSGETSLSLSPAGTFIGPDAAAFQTAGVTVISLMIGANDTKTDTMTPVGDYITRITAICSYFFQNVSTLQRIVVQPPVTPTPEGGATNPYGVWNTASATRIQQYQTALAALSIPNVSVGNLNGYNALRQPANYPSDQIHPDGQGAVLAGNAWADSIFAAEGGTTPPTPTSATITPSTVTLTSGQTQVFTGAAQPSNASQNGSYALAGPGTFNTSTRTYTAPTQTSNPQSATVTFTTATGSKTAVATITIPAVTVTPDPEPGDGFTADDRAMLTAIKAKTDLIPSNIDGKTLTQVLQIVSAAVAGKLSGAASNVIVIKGLDGTTTRLIVTTDSDGNRTNIQYPNN